MKVGLCGYPGSGKSTVFAALAPGASTNRRGRCLGNIKVRDERVDRLAKIFKPKKTTYAELTFMDVEGTGRMDTGAFSSEVVEHMRNADVLVHVVRLFDNPMVTKPADHERDASLFDDEILLLDLSLLERRQRRFQKEHKSGREVDVNDRCVAHLEEGAPLRSLSLKDEELETLQGIQLLSQKPLILLYNMSEDAWESPEQASLRETADRGQNALSMAICGTIEAEIAELDQADQAEMLEGLGLGEPARDEFVRTAYRLVDLISFLTAGADECRAWPIRRGTVARKAAGKVHSDIERGFIRAEVYQIADLLEAGSEQKLKATGKLRLEGKEYVVKDGDVINFRFNV